MSRLSCCHLGLVVCQACLPYGGMMGSIPISSKLPVFCRLWKAWGPGIWPLLGTVSTERNTLRLEDSRPTIWSPNVLGIAVIVGGLSYEELSIYFLKGPFACGTLTSCSPLSVSWELTWALPRTHGQWYRNQRCSWPQSHFCTSLA